MNLLAKLAGKPDDSDLGYSSEEKKIFASSFRIGRTVVAFGVAGLVAMALWADGARVAEIRFSAFYGADLLVAAAAASAVVRAAADPSSKASLKADLDAQKITTRNAVIDRELGALVT